MSLRAYLEVAVGETLSPETIESLEALDRLLVRFGSVVDLEGFGSDARRYQRYFGEALAARPWLPPEGRAVDIGSGGGSPVLPLAVAGRELAWTLLEPNERKAMFLEEAVRALGLVGARVVRARYESWSPESPADLITVRGVRVSEGMRDKIRAELRPGGRLLWFSSERQLHDASVWAGWSRRDGPIQLVAGGGFLGVFEPSA